MKKWLRFILFIITTSNHVVAQVQLDNRSAYSLSGYASILSETEDPLSIQEAWAAYRQNKFAAVQRTSYIESGFVKNIYWVALPIQNTLTATQNLEAGIDNGGIFQIEFYLLNTNGQVLSQFITGSKYDFYTRPIQYRRFLFPMAVEPLASLVIFYRVDMRGNALHLPLLLEKRGSRQGFDSRISLFYAVYSGGLLFVSLFSFLAWLYAKNRLYLFYSLYVLSFCLCFLGDGNFDVVWLYPHWPFLATLSPTIYGLFFCGFMLLFMSGFLQLEQSHKRMNWTVKLWLGLLAADLVLLPLAYVVFTNMALRMIVFTYTLFCFAGALVVQISCIVLRIKDNYKPAYLYGAALGFVIMALCMYLLRVLSIIPDLIPSYVYTPLGVGMEIIILSFALIYTYNFYKDQHQQLSISLAQQKLDFSNQLIQIQQAEQKRIAQDLHDELGGNLAALKMNLQSLPLEDVKLTSQIIQLIDKASDNARNIAHDLMPPEFERTSLRELLQTFFNRLNTESGIRFHFYSSGKNNRFDKRDDLVIYRIIIELTNNIIKHSGASEATVQLIYYEEQLEIMAEDNGKGFTNTSSNGMGLSNVQSRVNYLGGSLTIDSTLHGTTIIVKLPYKKENGSA